MTLLFLLPIIGRNKAGHWFSRGVHRRACCWVRLG